MNYLLKLAVLLAALGFAALAATGVDFVISRTGLGMLLLGVGVFVISLIHLFKPSRLNGGWLPIFSCLGGLYFIWRAISGGPIGLAFPDVVLVLIFLAVYLVTLSCKTVGKRVLLSALFLLCAVNLGVALMQGLSDEAFFVWKAEVDTMKRVTGLFDHYNPFAAFLNGSIFFFLSFVLFGQTAWWRIASGIFTIGILVALISSGSRGGWVSLIAGGAVWSLVVLTYLKQKKSKAFGVAMILTICFFVVGLTSSVWVLQKLTEKRSERASEFTGRELTSEAASKVLDGGRLGYQQLAFEIFQDSPAVGMGPRAFSYLSLEKWDSDKLGIWENPPVFAHNEYLQTLSDYGLVGLIIVMALGLAHVILGIFSSVSATDSRSELSIFQLGAIGGLAAILSQCFFSFLLHVPSCMALAALLVGILGSRAEENPDPSPKLFSARLEGFFGMIVSATLVILGGVLTHSYLLNREAKKQLESAVDEQSIFRALDTMADAGKAGRNPKVFERIGRLSMNFAVEAMDRKDQERAERFNLKAKSAFESALEYNPHLPAGIAALPRIEDALGNRAEAEKGHERAMKKLWAREYRLHPYFYAAESSFMKALQAHYDGKKKEAFLGFREARRRILRSREIIGGLVGHSQQKVLRSEVEGWTAYMEARRLFREGDRVWKNARPRNPELAYALMLEAQKRYQASEPVLRGKDANWDRQTKQLEVNLDFLKSGQVQPAKLGEEELKAILDSEEGLDSPSATR